MFQPVASCRWLSDTWGIGDYSTKGPSITVGGTSGGGTGADSVVVRIDTSGCRFQLVDSSASVAVYRSARTARYKSSDGGSRCVVDARAMGARVHERCSWNIRDLRSRGPSGGSARIVFPRPSSVKGAWRRRLRGLAATHLEPLREKGRPYRAGGACPILCATRPTPGPKQTDRSAGLFRGGKTAPIRNFSCGRRGVRTPDRWCVKPELYH